MNDYHDASDNGRGVRPTSAPDPGEEFRVIIARDLFSGFILAPMIVRANETESVTAG